MSLLVLGTVALDTVKTPSGERRDILGGSASHFSMSARLFTGVSIAAVIGKDFPRKYVDFLKAKGADLSCLMRQDGKTFRWEGKYEGDLNTAHTLKTELGVLAAFNPVLCEAQRKAKYVFLANVDPEIQRSLIRKIRSPRLVGLDTMNFWIGHKRKALFSTMKLADIFIVNEQEARSLSGESNLIKAAEFLTRHGPKIALVKKGEHGVLLYEKDFKFCLPAYPLNKVTDPTGAGDTFAGGFMGYLARCGSLSRNSLKKAVAYGTICASFNVEGFGVDRTGRLSFNDLRRRLNEFKKYVSF